MKCRRSFHDLSASLKLPAAICSFTVSAILTRDTVGVRACACEKISRVSCLAAVVRAYVFASSPALSSSLDTLRSSGVYESCTIRNAFRSLFIHSTYVCIRFCAPKGHGSCHVLTVKSSGETQLSPRATPVRKRTENNLLSAWIAQPCHWFTRSVLRATYVPPSVMFSSPARAALATDAPSVAAYLPP